jgi:hypothetical protein
MVAYLFVNRKYVVGLMKRRSVKIFLIAGLLGVAAYHKISGVEFVILAYTLFAVLFVRSFNSALLSIFVNNESRTPAVFALLCIAAIPFLLLMKASTAAEQVAIYAYYFLVITVVLRVVEMKLDIDRENPLLEALGNLFARIRSRIAELGNPVRRTSWVSLKSILFSPASRSFFLIMLALLAAQSIYWKN